MNRFKLWATNLVTAIVAVVLTSIFWVSAYQNDRTTQEGGDNKVENASGDHAQTPAYLVVGPSGLAIPVAGVTKANLVDTFTEARAGGSRPHDAIDIMAPEGTPVYAAAPGKVEKIYFSEGGGGNAVYVRSGDGRWSYYYAHLRDYAGGLAEGLSVHRGMLLGHVGHSGNASEEGPHLHFAVNRMAPGEGWWQGRPINPYPLLAGSGADR
jgi:murein DD-endopeptidase MepM/ murein hydrolase activator NlpD